MDFTPWININDPFLTHWFSLQKSNLDMNSNQNNAIVALTTYLKFKTNLCDIYSTIIYCVLSSAKRSTLDHYIHFKSWRTWSTDIDNKMVLTVNTFFTFYSWWLWIWRLHCWLFLHIIIQNSKIILIAYVIRNCSEIDPSLKA